MPSASWPPTRPFCGVGASVSNGRRRGPRGGPSHDRADVALADVAAHAAGRGGGDIPAPSTTAAAPAQSHGDAARAGVCGWSARSSWARSRSCSSRGSGSSLNYFETVDQAVAHKATLGSQTFRLEGVVVPGTVHRIPGGVAFVAAGTVHRVDVVNHGNPPQLFQPDIPVVVVGHFSGSSFVSDQLIVDHSAQYIQQHPNRVRAPNGTTR